MTEVAIVGAGLMGTALAYPLADRGHDVRLVGTHLDGGIIERCKKDGHHPKLNRFLPSGVRAFYVDELPSALDGVKIIVSGVNSLGAHWIGRTLGPHLKPDQIIIAVTKGLEVTDEGDLQILPDILRAELPEAIRDSVKLAAIGGPCIAGELAGHRPSCVVFGSRDGNTVALLAETFRTPYYHIWTTMDLVGLEYSAALKNAYTLGVGLAAGMLESQGGADAAGAHMHNLAAALFGQSCIEIEKLLALAGATRSFAYGLPGAGDLFVTFQGGRTVRLGRLLGLGHTFAEAREIMAGETLESVEIIRAMARALPFMTRQGKLGPDELPFLRTLIAIVVGGEPVTLPLEKFFGEEGWLRP